MRRSAVIAIVAAWLAVLPGVYAVEERAPVSFMPAVADYTMLWWADGPPYIRDSKVPPKTDTLCLQSGSWGLAFDARRVRALRFGHWAGLMSVSDAAKPGRSALADLPSVDWEATVTVGGKRFSCVGRAETEDEHQQPVRFVESGRFFQRVTIEGLRFADDSGKELHAQASLEISAWPDRLHFRLMLESAKQSEVGSVELRFGEKRAAAKLSGKTVVQLTVVEAADTPRPTLKADPELKLSFDAALGCHVLELPTRSRGAKSLPPEPSGRLDRWRVTLQNDSARPTVARLMFAQSGGLNLTGFTPMLCEVDGSPTGLPVQISKNWHKRAGKPALAHEGPWFHGFASVRLPPHSRRELVFQMVYSRYGGVFAASHGQLSLIGWGHNQFWDQAAIGSFGESICFEPGRMQRRCFIDDIRPLMTVSQRDPAKRWGWSDNCGGGDFIMWQGDDGVYQVMRATRTDYRAYGPCLTGVSYSEESVGGELAARMDVSLPRSDDYLRTFIRIRYDVRSRMAWQRLAFFQLGADHYNETPARRVAIGNLAGRVEEWTPKTNENAHDRVSVPLVGEQPWVSIHGVDKAALKPGRAAASRGVIVRSWQAVLGGKSVASPSLSSFSTGRDKYQRTVIELSPPNGLQQLIPGDYVEAALELVVFPAVAKDYYGPDQEFARRLQRSADTYEPVMREAQDNALKCEAVQGVLENAYPLRVAVNRDQAAEVKVVGGVGFVPVTFTGLSEPTGYAVAVNGERLDQSVHGNDFWQTDYNPATERWQQTYNIKFPAGRSSVIRFATTPKSKDRK